ncbi:MAG: hypothetical protein SH850_28770 [Planctomycetaceae bacterium]|nr:hypothetical protein [Planctomycetaceae bacterium]
MPIEFAVIWQSWSEEFTASEITEMLAQLPLCRVVCVTGPWCESDQRTRRAWPPALVTPWWHAGQRLQHELAAVQSRAAHAVPWTASREELWLWEQTTPDQSSLAGLAVSLRMADHHFSAMLGETLIDIGATVVQYASDDVDAVLVDADPWSPDRARALAEVVQDVSPIPVIALSGWTIPELASEVQACGVLGVCSKFDGVALIELLSARQRHAAAVSSESQRVKP